MLVSQQLVPYQTSVNIAGVVNQRTRHIRYSINTDKSALLETGAPTPPGMVAISTSGVLGAAIDASMMVALNSISAGTDKSMP